jgi:hypothetical protein
MPRNVSGTYSLPLPPVVPNTVIQAAWANTTTDDIAQGITDSLDRNGRGGMIAPFRLVDGSVLQPAFAFASETGTGLYKVSPGIMGVAVMGVQVAQWSGSAYSLATDLNVTGDLGVTGNIAFNGSLSITGDVIFTGNLAVDGDLGLTGTISVSGGIASLDDISVDENFDGSAGFFATNISTGTHSYAVFRANNNTGHAVGLAAIGSANLDWPGNSDTGVLFSDHAQGISLIATAGSSMIRFYDGGFTEHMRLSGGNLGIGGGAPYDKLSVLNGSIQVVSGYGGAGSTPTQRYMIFGAVNSFGGSAIAPAGLSVQYTRVSGDTDYGSDLLFLTSADNAGAEQMRIDRSGNVGIGVSTILAALHVKRAGAATIFIESTTSGAGLALKCNNTGGSADQISFQNAAGGAMYALGAANIGSVGNNEFSLYSYVIAQNMISALNTGTVLLGPVIASVPGSAKLNVNGGSTIGSLADWPAKANTIFTLANPGVRLGIGYTAADLPEIQGFDTTPNARSIIMQRYGGSVGVGPMTGPSTLFHIKGSGGGVRYRLENTDNGGHIGDLSVDGSASLVTLGTSTSTAIAMYVAFAYRFRIGGDGTALKAVHSNVDYDIVTSPISSSQCPVGSIIMGRASGAFTGCTFGSTFVFSGSQFIGIPGLGGGAAVNITSGTWRFIGHDTNASNLDVSLWVRVA